MQTPFGHTLNFNLSLSRPPFTPTRERGDLTPPVLLATGTGGGAPLPVGWERVGEGPGVRGRG